MANFQPINTADRRSAERRSALDVHLCLVDLGDNRSAMLLDVSELGIGVQAVEGPGEGFTTTFRFQLPDTAVLIEGEGEIAWADRAGRMGIRFTSIAPDLQGELSKWVASEANPLFADQPGTEAMADLDARDQVAQLEARIIVSGWAQIQALNFLVDQIAAMTQAGGVAIAVEDGSGIVCKASSGIAPQVGVRVEPRSGLSWECVRTCEVVQCVDTENDPRVDRTVCRQLSMRSAMLVPVKKDGRVAGLVEVFSSQPHAFSNQTVILLRRVAEAVAALDETAPSFLEEPILEMPGPQRTAPVKTPITEKAAPPKPLEPEKKFITATPAPVVAKPMPQPAPIPAAPIVVKPVQAPPAQPVVVQRPVAVVPSAPPVVAPTPAGFAPAPTPAPRPAIVAPMPPPTIVQTTVTAPSPEPAVAVKPAPVAPAPPPIVKPIEKPAIVERYVAVETPRVVMPPPVIANEVAPERPLAKLAAEKIEIAPPPPPPRPRILAKPAPLPEVAFSGAAAAAAKRAPAVEMPIHPAPTKKEQEQAEPPVEEAAKLMFMPPEKSDVAGRLGRMFTGVAAALMIAALVYGGWYWTRPQPAPSSTPVTQPASTPAPVVLPPAPAVSTAALSGAVAPSSAAAVPAAVKTKPAKPSPALVQQRDQAAVNGPSPNLTNPPIMVAAPSARVTPEPAPAAPPIAIAPPNPAGVANLLAGPVVVPKLSAAVSQGVTGGKQVLRVQPLYPMAARTMQLSGTVTMLVHISKSGTVSQVKVLSGHPFLSAAAVDAVRRWKYEPFQLNGQPIENDINVQVRFDIPR
jgi:protein TonB